jgi:IS30 family transposase
MLGLDRSCSILAFVDRKARYNIFEKMNKKTSRNVNLATLKALRNMPLKSITNDRGLEFAGHKKCSKKLKVKIFFCEPYTSSQRGSNENRIGILRQYFPKKFDLRNVTNKQIKKVELEMNNRPMKCLDWKTPYEIMFKKSCTTEW